MHWVGCADEIDAVFRPGDAVLVKASRAVGLEGVAEQIAKLAEAWSVS